MKAVFIVALLLIETLCGYLSKQNRDILELLQNNALYFIIGGGQSKNEHLFLGKLSSTW